MAQPIAEETQNRMSHRAAPAVREDIRRQLEASVLYYSARLEQIEQRLCELDEEWDAQRALQAAGGAFAMLALARGRGWRLLAAGATGLLIHNAVWGWRWPFGIFRRLGFRTAREIMAERCALKAVRGDFRAASEESQDNIAARAQKAVEAADV